MNRSILGFDIKSYRMILNYHWPGNVRELQNVIKRAVVLTEGNYILPRDLRFGRLKKIDKKEIRKALIRARGNIF